MKRILLFVLTICPLITIGITTNTESGFHFKPEIQMFGGLNFERETGSQSSASYTNNFNVKNYHNILPGPIARSFVGHEHETMGFVRRVNTEILNIDYMTYQSGFTGEEKYKTVEDKEFHTYEFSKFIDIPVSVNYTKALTPGEVHDVDVQTTYSATNRYYEHVTNAQTSFQQFKAALSLEVGLYVGWDELIGVSVSQEAQYEYLIGKTIHQEIETFKERTEAYSVTTNERQYYINNNNYYVYYQVNLRQKYRVSFVTVFQYEYDRTKKTSGLFGKDSSWACNLVGIRGVETRYFLTPVDFPYIEYSLYRDDAKGNRIYISKSNPNIVFL